MHASTKTPTVSPREPVADAGRGTDGLLPASATRGFTLVELLVVMLFLGVLAAIALPRFGTTRERAHMSTIASDFRNLGASQERYYQQYRTYALDLSVLDFEESPGVQVEVTEATAQGWAGVGTHSSLEDNRGCAVYLGNAESPPLPNGQVHSAGPGAVQCTN